VENTSRREFALIGAVLAVGWAIWLHRIGVIDHDDMLSNELIFARENLASLLFRIPWHDQSPLYFLYLRALRVAGGSPSLVQVVNGVLVSLALIATYALALAFSGSRAVARAALLLGAVSPASLWLVRHGRMYPLQVLFSVLAALFVVRYLERHRPRDLAMFAGVSLLNVYTHFLGFPITALLFLPLIVDAWRPAARTAAAVAILALPQIVRVFALATDVAPARAAISLPSLSSGFLDRVSWFWFVNAGWGALRPAEQIVTAAYVGSIVLLAVIGLASVRRLLGVAAAVWIVLPLAIVGVVAARMDVRDRYFAWALPLVWIAVATGGFGALPARWLAGARADIARGVRAALAVAVAAASLWLVWQKLPERGPEASKLMTAVAQIYRPAMKVYMPPSSAMGLPRLIAQERGLPAGLQDVRALTPDTRPGFLQEAERGDEFIFFLFLTPPNAEMTWRTQHLLNRGYRQASIPVFGASARIFTQRPLDGWTREHSLGSAPSRDAIVEWARGLLRARPPLARHASPLAGAVVARVQPDGIARESRLFTSQYDERGAWRLGPEEWNAVEETQAGSGPRAGDVVTARPLPGSTLVIALPPMPMKKSLELTCGAAGGGPRPAAVSVELYAGGQWQSGHQCSATPRWNTLTAATPALDGQRADVVLLLTTAADTATDVALRLEPSPTVVEPLVLTNGRKLSDRLERLRVHRLVRERRIEAQPDGRTYLAADMHEAAALGVEGSVHRVWSLGTLLWDAVGSTRQPGQGDVRKGIWAHPRDGTILVIETPAATLGERLHGFAGFTDFSLKQAAAAGVTAPVRFVVSIDGTTVYTRDAARTAGWTEIAVPVSGADREHRVRIEISSASDRWAHFIFDLWSD
jgi:hypothetical protein